MHIHGLFVLFPLSIHLPYSFQKYSHTADNYTSNVQDYPYIFPIGLTDVPHLDFWIPCLSMPFYFPLTSYQPFIFCLLWIMVHSPLPVLKKIIYHIFCCIDLSISASSYSRAILICLLKSQCLDSLKKCLTISIKKYSWVITGL